MDENGKMPPHFREEYDTHGRTISRDQWISLFEWAVIVGVITLDVILSALTGISVSEPTKNVMVYAIVIAIWPFTAVLTRLSGFGIGGELIAENVTKLLVLTHAAGLCSYFLAANQAPLHDALMVEIDGFLGFRWPVFFDWMNHHAMVATALFYLYHSMLIEVALILFVVGAFYPRRPNRLITALVFSVVLTFCVFASFPVAGPFFYFQHLDLPVAGYELHYLKMRAHALPSIPMNDLRGIISFPSFHVSSAVILAYLFRGVPVLFPLAIAVNVGMSVGALFIGGHYLSDALAGLVVGGFTVVVLQWLDGDVPEPRLALRRRAELAVCAAGQI